MFLDCIPLYFTPDPHQVAAKYLFDVTVVVAAIDETSYEIRIIVYTFQPNWETIANAIEVGADADMINANEFYYVIKMVQHVIECRKGVWPNFARIINVELILQRVSSFELLILQMFFISLGAFFVIFPCFLSQECGSEVHHYDTAVFGQSLDQLVAQVAFPTGREVSRRGMGWDAITGAAERSNTS